MRVITAHNFYQQPGGEDEVFNSETRLLKKHGHDIMEFIENNSAIKGMNPFSAALKAFWSFSSARRMDKILADFKPDLVHFHNTFPLISPSAIYACSRNNIPVVVSLHNPRLICPGANLCRNGKPCEKCLSKIFPWPAIFYRCYRNSYLQTIVVATMLFFHRLLRTWQQKVDLYLVATEFYKEKFIKAGLPAERIMVKPYFVEDKGMETESKGDYVLFIGRLSPEKGILTLLKSWNCLRDIPLKIRGEGVLFDKVNKIIKDRGLEESVKIIRRLDKNRLYDLIKRSRFLVIPSEGFYETFGLVILEAFSCGIPVLASRIGVMTEIIQDGINGLHFTAGDENDLANKARFLFSNPSEIKKMGEKAREAYEEKYSESTHYIFIKQAYGALVKNKS